MKKTLGYLLLATVILLIAGAIVFGIHTDEGYSWGKSIAITLGMFGIAGILCGAVIKAMELIFSDK